ncbi:MAG: ASCH domain-containing protein, partial [Planctomyces sp.]
MKALSIRQPFASLIAAGKKTVELRTWYTHYRGPLLICAAKSATGLSP